MTPTVSGGGSVNAVVAPVVDQFTGRGYTMGAIPKTPLQSCLLGDSTLAQTPPELAQFNTLHVSAQHMQPPSLFEDETEFPKTTVPSLWFTNTVLPPMAPPSRSETLANGFLMFTAPTPT